MKHLGTRLVPLLAFLIVPWGVCAAQTPDGETPAEESVCDALKAPGITPGLYGLCVAFCEALDADATIDELVCNQPSEKLLENYNRKKGPLDPSMPCLFSECLCWDEELLQQKLGVPLNCSDQYKEIPDKGTYFETYVARKMVEARVWGVDTKDPAANCYFKTGIKIPIATPLTFAEGLACRNSLLLYGGSCFQ